MLTHILIFLDTRKPYLFHFFLINEEVSQATQFRIIKYVTVVGESTKTGHIN